MLIYLQNINNDQTFYLLNKNTFCIGRRAVGCDLLIQDDQSISKTHAQISIRDNCVFLTDLGSKYKTCLNDKEVIPQEEIALKQGDKIKFGVFNSVYQLEICNYTVCCSCLKSDTKAKLKEFLKILGINYSDNWSTECTHLTLSSVTLSIKLLLALLDEKPIVKPDYWTAFMECTRKEKKPPKVEDYRDLPCAEPLLKEISLIVKPGRKMLFKGYEFLFCKEGIRKQMEDIIRKAGGSTVSWESDQPLAANLLKTSSKLIVIQTSDEDNSFTTAVKDYLKKGNRTIPYHEIAHAILNCSMEKYCNPKFQLAKNVFSGAGPKVPTQVPLVEETQSECVLNPKTERVSETCIPETMDTGVNADVLPVENYKLENEQIITTDLENIDEPVVAIRFKKPEPEVTDKPINIDKEYSKRKSDAIVKPAKKTKLDESIISEKSRPSKPQIVESFSASSSNSSSSSKLFSSLKRKAENIPQEFETSKRKNPFATLFNKKSKNSKDPKMKQDSSISNTNVYDNETPRTSSTSVSRTKSFDDEAPRATLTPKIEIDASSSIVNKTTNKSYKSRLDITDIDGFWLSKQIKMPKTEEEDCLNEDIKKFIDQFKDSIRISVLNITSRSVVGKENETLDGSSLSGRNFKRFRKVKPLNPQQHILKSNCKIGANNMDTAVPTVHLEV